MKINQNEDGSIKFDLTDEEQHEVDVIKKNAIENGDSDLVHFYLLDYLQKKIDNYND